MIARPTPSFLPCSAKIEIVVILRLRQRVSYPLTVDDKLPD
jgi:hypothetical protein